jgi:hypothetical protein
MTIIMVNWNGSVTPVKLECRYETREQKGRSLRSMDQSDEYATMLPN